ncbi:MAG: O-methyltransferase [Breznakia sp.]
MEDLINEMQEYAKEHRVPIMESTGLSFLLAHISAYKYTNILEIGSAIGYSAIRMAMLSKNIQITTIERDENRYIKACENVKKAGLDNRIQVVFSDALTWTTTDMYDFIFIDAAKAQYIKFFERYQKHLQPKGSILSDNLKFHGMVDTKMRIQNRNTRQLVTKIRRYIDFLKQSEEYKTTFYEIGDGIAISVKKHHS